MDTQPHDTTVVPDASANTAPSQQDTPREPRRMYKTAFAFDNALAEQVYDSREGTHQFIVKLTTGETKTVPTLTAAGQNVVVAPVESDLIEKGRVLLPSQCVPHGSTRELLSAITSHVHSCVRLPEDMRVVVAYYILFTWLADRFETAPYLRLIGDLGTGKSRALRVIGDLCYKPFKGSGSSTMAAIFRGIQQFGVCTLVLDESDFDTRRDDHREMMNMLRTGFQKEFGVLRAEREGDNYVPRDFAVYGPKILAGRSNFPDAALESRCIRIYMQSGADLGCLAPELPSDYPARAAEIRNKLLSWRLENYFAPVREVTLPAIEPRLQQVFGPLATVIDDPTALNALQEIMSGMQSDMTDARKVSKEGLVLETLVAEAAGLPPGGKIYVNDVRRKLCLQGISSARQVATFARGFGLEPLKDRVGTYVVFDPKEHHARLVQYGLAETAPVEEPEEDKLAA